MANEILTGQSEGEYPGKNPAVSIIINCFNEAQFLRENLDSVFAQTFQDWEIVFWDNASSDGSGEIAASYGERVRCFRSETMVPLGRARKLAFEQTRGDYIAILDADDVWLPQKLERQLGLFQANADVGMTYCDVTYFDGDGDRNRLFSLTKPYRGQAFGKLLGRNFIFSSAMMFRRTALDTLGCAFDDRFARAQDYDLTLRLAYHYLIDYVDEPLTKWRVNGLAEKPWKSSLVSREAEILSSVTSLVDSYPDIETTYGVELESLYKDLDYACGVNAWRDSSPAEARPHLRRHLGDKKFALVYICTFLVSFDLFYKIRIAFRNLNSRT